MWSLFMLVVAMALGIRWLVNVAEARGRSQVFWGLAAAVVCVLGFCVAALLAQVLWDTEEGSDIIMVMVGMIAPILVSWVVVAGLGLVVQRLPVRVTSHRRWQVHCHKNGAGHLEIEPDALHLVWPDRRQAIPRSQLHTVKVDGECLRVGWGDESLLLLPMMRPQTRDGRIRQSQTLVRLLSSELPVAVGVIRDHQRSA